MIIKKKFSAKVVLVLLIMCMVLSTGLLGCTNGTLPASGTQIGSDDQEPPSIDGWVLPIVVAITGNSSEEGRSAAWGFDYGVKAVNEQGGIRGIPVTIIIKDVASDNSKVSAEIGVAADSALIVVGPPTESLFRAGERVSFNAGMPAVGAATDNSNREACQPFAISCISDAGSAAESAAEAWMKAEKFTNVCAFYSSSTEGRAEYFEEAISAGGKQLTEKIELGTEELDAEAVAKKAIDSGADAFYIDTNKEDTIKIVEQLKILTSGNANSLKILCGPLSATQDLLESDEDGVMVGVRIWSPVDPSNDAEKRKAFNDAFDKNVGDSDQYNIAVDYYQAALMLKQAIDTLGLTGAPDRLAEEREILANYLYNSGTITTILGDFVVESGNKHMVSQLYRITDKGFQP